MEKVLLDKQIIKKELLRYCFYLIKIRGLRVLILSIPIICFLSINSTAMVFGLIVTLLLALIVNIGCMIDLYKISKLDFNITIDKLISVQEGNGRIRNIDPYILYFKQSGKYVIPRRRYYSDFKNITMDFLGLFYSSNINDEFYIISISSTKPILVYNTNLFVI